MAKKEAVSAKTTYKEIMTSIRKGVYAPVYILMGEEPYYLDKIADALERKVVADEDKDFNFNAFYGADVSIEVVAGAAKQFPMMSDRRMVILKEAQAMSNAKNQLDKLASYVSQPTTSTVLVIVYKGDSLNKTSALLKAASKQDAVVFNSEKYRDHQLMPLLKEYCTDKNVRIEDKAMSMLVEFIGSDLHKLFGAVDKLMIVRGEGNPIITPEMVEANIGISKDYNGFELIKAIAEKNYNKSIRIVDHFRKDPKRHPIPPVTGLLSGFFTKLTIAAYAPDKSDRSLMPALGFKSPYALTDYRTALGKYNQKQCLDAVHELRIFDCATKGINSTQNEYDLLKQLIFRLFTI